MDIWTGLNETFRHGLWGSPLAASFLKIVIAIVDSIYIFIPELWTSSTARDDPRLYPVAVLRDVAGTREPHPIRMLVLYTVPDRLL